MNILQLTAILFLLGSVPSVLAASDHDHQGHDHGDEHAHEGEEMQPEDYLGFSMEVPKRTQELIGLTTAQVERTHAQEKIMVSGRIMQDIENVAEAYAPQSGTLKQCSTTIGSVVTKDQVICLVDVPEKCLEVRSPISGVVIAAFVKEGDSVDPVTPIQTIADLTKMSAHFDVYEKDTAKVLPGQQVAVYASAYPQETFKGTVIFVSPRVDETTFTTKIRVEIDNPQLRLKPGMFVRGEIIIEGKQAHLKVPTDSVQNLDGINVVFLKEEEEFFTPTEVHVQYASHQETFVQGDFKAGDLVVTEGAFILKSKIMESEIVGGCAHGH